MIFFENCFNRALEHGPENGMTVQSVVEAVAPSLMYTVDPGKGNQKPRYKFKAISPDTASQIVSICLVEYKQIFPETSA